MYQRLRDRGYQVFAVNPNADEVEGDRAYHDLHAIPDGVDAVVIGTRPEIADETMRECAELGIRHVWMHRGPGAGSVSTTAAKYGREHGITVIDGGCPCMFGPTADPGHKVMRDEALRVQGRRHRQARGGAAERARRAQGWQVVGVTTKKQLFIAPPQAIILMREVQPALDARAA